MCGRFALGIESQDLQEQLGRQYFGSGRRREETERSQGRSRDVQQDQPDDGASHTSTNERDPGGDRSLQWSSESGMTWKPRYNVAPKSGGVVVRRSSTGYELSVLKWGLVPHWTKTPDEDPHSTINAMMESVIEGRPTWRVRETKRCLVIAQGFYEWVTKGKEKVPHFIKRSDGKLMVFAGLWDYCNYKGNFDPVSTYTIITTPVNHQLRQIHSRMPAILDTTEDIATWLSDCSFDKVKSLLKPFEGQLEFYAVDKGVGKVGTESADLIKPVAQKTGSLDSLFAKQKASSPTKLSTDLDRKPRPAKRSQEKGVPLKRESDDVVLMNADEDSKAKTEQLSKLAQREGTAPLSRSKKRESDEEVQEAPESQSGGAKKSAEKKRKTDEHGNATIESFFAVNSDSGSC
ncbi:putative peptide hydrolase [Sporobolomyces koalae]|uniref:putative peptide hydrolase n=1 Tax=Sporobolomyces koalae TaxID=500713 RepID=UPI00317770A6